MAIYTINILQSKIEFNVCFLQYFKMKGHFTSFSGTITATEDNDIIFDDITIEIDVASVNTNEPTRDQHLISADFFHADLYPKILFNKKNIVKIDNYHFKIYGLLQIKNIVKEVAFDVEVTYEDNDRSLINATFHCTSIINRMDFGLIYGSVIENTPFFIAKDININATFKLQ